jgi:cytoskeletal protein CcmA (bactofilin family)
MEMFKGFEKNNNPVTSAAATVPAEGSGLEQHASTPVATPVSCIGSAMSIVGNVECSGAAQVFGRIEGQLRATELVIGEGAHVEGSIEAQEVTISGRVKGTVRAIRVSLVQAHVEGDIFHRSLSIDDSSEFEGASRRVENPIERRIVSSADSSNASGKAAQKKGSQNRPLDAPAATGGDDAPLAN